MATSYVESMLGEREMIVHVTRQHWYVVLRAIFIDIVFILIIVGLTTLAIELLGPLAWLGLILLVIPLVSLGSDLLDWWNRQFIITNRRVIQIAGVFNKNVTDSSLEKVNDVKMEQSALGRLLDYGDIEILTASELGVNLFRRIAEPIKFKTAMLNAKEKMGHDEGRYAVEEEPRPGNIPAMIAELDQLRQRGVLTEQEFQAKKAELLAKM